jgi:hypothetical protein
MFLYGDSIACSLSSIISILLQLTGISIEKLTKRDVSALVIEREREKCLSCMVPNP